MILSKSETIEQEILNDIYAGRYTDKLPSEKEMAKIYNTSPVTAAKILNRLKDKNIVKRIGGRGTFINHEGLHRKVKMYLPFPEKMLDAIENELKKSFPEIAFEFVGKSFEGLEGFSENADISFMTSYFPDSYDKYFAPLPENMLKDFLDEDRYYSDVFLTHCYNNAFYGIPFSASSCIFICNKKLLRKYADVEPGKCIFPELLQDINSRLKSENGGISLFDSFLFRKGTALEFIFSGIPENEIDRFGLKNISWENVESGLKNFQSLYSNSIAKGASFKEGKAIFARICRQAFGKNFKGFDFPWDLYPISFGSSRVSILASESLCVSARTSNQEKLFEICRAFLSPGIQNIIGAHRYGIPVLKSAALKSMDSSEYRDDVFYNEMKNVIYNYEFLEKPLMNSFISDINALFAAQISYEDFYVRTQNLFRLNELNMKTREVFVHGSDF